MFRVRDAVDGMPLEAETKVQLPYGVRVNDNGVAIPESSLLTVTSISELVKLVLSSADRPKLKAREVAPVVLMSETVKFRIMGNDRQHPPDALG